VSDLTREIIPIAVMYGFVLLLAPFIAYAMWLAFEGDRPSEPIEAAQPQAEAPSVEHAPVTTGEVVTAA
jgi:hypothetical protein